MNLTGLALLDGVVLLDGVTRHDGQSRQEVPPRLGSPLHPVRKCLPDSRF